MAGETDHEGLRRYLLLVSAVVLYGAGFIDFFLPYSVLLLAAVSIAGFVAYLRTRTFFDDLIAIIPLVGLVHPLAELAGFPEIRLSIFPLMVTVGAVFPLRTLVIVALFAVFPFVLGTTGLVPLSAKILTVALSCLLPALFVRREKRVRKTLEKNLNALTSDARDLDRAGLSEVGSFLREDAFHELVGSVIELRENLDYTLYILKHVIPCNTAAFFALEDGDRLISRSFLTDTPPLSDKPIKIGEGYVGLVALQKKSTMIGDLGKRRMQPGYYPQRRKIASLIAVPVLDGDILMGVLVVDSLEENAFYEKDRDILALYGNVVVHQFRKARTYTQIQNSARGFKALHDISSDLITTIRLEEIAERLVSRSARILENDFCVLFRVRADGRHKILAAKGYETKDEVLFSGDDSMLSWLAGGEATIFHITDLKKQPARVLPFDLKGLRTFLALPLKHEGRVEAILALGAKKPDAFDARGIELFKTLANLAAVSVANALLHDRIQRMAVTDGLTGLFNHRHFQERLSEEFSRAERYPGSLSMLLLDIDHFKRVNDDFGHPAGDAVLKGVAGILRSTLRSAADFPARYGGEEFAAVLVNTDADGAFKIAQRLRKQVEKERFQTDAGPIRITLSVGVCTYPAEAANKTELIERADQALYHAKHSGRNRCVRYRDVPPGGGDAPGAGSGQERTAWDRP